MRNVKLCGSIVLGFACAASAASRADDAPAEAKRPAQLFEQLDANKDGKLTADEVPAERRPYFERLLRTADKDKNGELTAAEFQAGIEPDAPVTAPPGGPEGRSEGRPDLDPKRMFKRFDRDGNNKLSLDELPDPLRERWKPAFDRIGKSELTEEEFARAAERARSAGAGMMGPPPFMKLLDKNGDRKLSKAELSKLTEVFDELDVNRDGELDARELFGRPAMAAGPPPERPAAAKRPESVEKPAKAEKPAEQPKQPETPAAAARRKGALQRFDANGDGRVSREEARGRIRKNFDKLDANGDGVLEKDELQKALRQMKSAKKADGLNVAGGSESE